MIYCLFYLEINALLFCYHLILQNFLILALMACMNQDLENTLKSRLLGLLCWYYKIHAPDVVKSKGLHVKLFVSGTLPALRRAVRELSMGFEDEAPYVPLPHNH